VSSTTRRKCRPTDRGNPLEALFSLLHAGTQPPLLLKKSTVEVLVEGKKGGAPLVERIWGGGGVPLTAQARGLSGRCLAAGKKGKNVPSGEGGDREVLSKRIKLGRGGKITQGDWGTQKECGKGGGDDPMCAKGKTKGVYFLQESKKFPKKEKKTTTPIPKNLILEKTKSSLTVRRDYVLGGGRSGSSFLEKELMDTKKERKNGRVKTKRMAFWIEKEKRLLQSSADQNPLIRER